MPCVYSSNHLVRAQDVEAWQVGLLGARYDQATPQGRIKGLFDRGKEAVGIDVEQGTVLVQGGHGNKVVDWGCPEQNKRSTMPAWHPNPSSMSASLF